MYGNVPPVTVVAMLPLLTPLHEALVTTSDTTKTAGWEIVNEVVAAQ